MEAEPVSGKYPITRSDLRKRLRRHNVRVTFVGATTLVSTVIGGYSYMLDKTADAAEKAVAPLQEQVIALWAELHRYEEVQNANNAATVERLVDLARDVRAQYRAQQTGAKQPRLEVEPTSVPIDAGVLKPDGGSK